MDPISLLMLVEASGGIGDRVVSAANRKSFMKQVVRHFEKSYTVKNIDKYSDSTNPTRDRVIMSSIEKLLSRRISDAHGITKDVRDWATDLCLAITWEIVENDEGVFGLQRYTRAIGTVLGWNADEVTPICKYIAAEGHLETLKKLAMGEEVSDDAFSSVKRATKQLANVFS
ncbi:MAG: hypothetical protein HGB19_04055 [Chlorobiales bacterium]|nr:hypothetical protein [Chlorobiales bacterium]